MALSVSTSRDDMRLRFRVFVSAVCLIVGFLGVRLIQMQLLDSEAYASEAEGNAIEQKLVRPARGYIYDRNGTLLVDNETTLSVEVSPRYFDPAKLPLVAELAGVSLERLRGRWEEIGARSRYQTATLLGDVSFGVFSRLKENQYRLQGLTFEEGQQRRYHGPARLSHALGYVREINSDQLDQLREQGYRMGDLVGRTGVEKEYEPVLRGRMGRSFVLVNVHGMEVQSYEGGVHDVAPQSGVGLKLAIDLDTQALAESLFVGKRGGAVMMDVKTGGVLSMVSAPDFDLSEWRGRLSQEFVDYVHRNPDKPLFNRATKSSQPPGSTWKPFMALVGLQEGMIEEDTQLYCPGGYMLGRFYRCHGGSHGNIDVHRAIQISCNTFFFRVMNDRLLEGRRMNLDVWGMWARRFGFGTLAPLDLPEQDPGLIPDSAYYDERFPNGWGPGYTVNLGIGQGNMGATPLQLARYTAAIANGGMLLTPHVVMAQVDPVTGDEHIPSRPRPRRIPIDSQNVRIVQDAMRAVVTSGTGRGVAISAIGEHPEVPMAGKTGTSENPLGKDHSVFIAYAPADDPEVAVGVIVENAGYGSTAAAPIASLMIEQYLRGSIQRPGVMARALNARSEGMEVRDVSSRRSVTPSGAPSRATTDT